MSCSSLSQSSPAGAVTDISCADCELLLFVPTHQWVTLQHDHAKLFISILCHWCPVKSSLPTELDLVVRTEVNGSFQYVITVRSGNGITMTCP